MTYLRSLLEQIGLQGERVRMVNLSAAMAARFAEVTTEMVEKIRELGPNPLGGDSVDPGFAEKASLAGERNRS